MRTMSTAVLAAVVAGGIAGDGWARGGGGSNHVLELAALGHYMAVAHHPSQNTAPGGLTVECWVNYSQPGLLVQKRAPSDCEFGLDLAFFARCGPATDLAYPQVPMLAWHHVAASFDDEVEEVRVYIDGALVASASGGAETATTTYPILIGMMPGFGHQLLGRVDNVRLWDHARTAAQIGQLMRVQLRPSEVASHPGLIASWTFEDGALDATGNNNGVLYGGASIVVDDFLRPPCVGDVDGTGAVDGVDLATILTRWGAPAAKFPEADTNDDGLIDGADLAAVLSGWGACP